MAHVAPMMSKLCIESILPLLLGAGVVASVVHHCLLCCMLLHCYWAVATLMWVASMHPQR